MKNRILLKFQNMSIPAILNDTVAARDFTRRLPLTVSGTRSADNYRFPAAIGCFDPEETQIGWRNGDISIAGGWLRVFFDGEETSGDSAGIMVIAQIRQMDLSRIKKLPNHTRLTIGAPERAAAGIGAGERTTGDAADALRMKKIRVPAAADSPPTGGREQTGTGNFRPPLGSFGGPYAQNREKFKRIQTGRTETSARAFDDAGDADATLKEIE